jgi:hypothetical protein
MLDGNGEWKADDAAWKNEDPRQAEEWNKLRNKVIAVNKIIMGNQDKSSPTKGKKKLLWRLIGQFRASWLSEGVATRFEDERFDTQLGRVRKGRYRTYADLGVLGSLRVLFKQALSSVGLNKDPYAGVKLSNGKDIQEVDKGNMRRNLAEITWFILMYGTAMMLMSLAEDDEDKKRRYRLLANLAIRSYQDIGLYASPGILDTVLGNVIPATSAIKDTMKFFEASGKVLIDDDYTYEQWLLKLTRAGFIPQTTLINKFKTMTERDLSSISR